MALLTLASIFTTYVFPEDWEETLRKAGFLRLGVSIAGAIIIGFVLFAVTRKRSLEKSRKVRCVCTFIVLVICLFWCIIVNKNQAGDGLVIYNIAVDMLTNGALDPAISEANPFYFSRYPFQISYFFYIYTAVKLFGAENFIAYRVLNIISVIIIVNVLSKVAERASNKSVVGSYVCILATLFLPLSLFSSFLYGNIPSLAFSLLACYMALTLDFSNKRQVVLKIVAMFACLFLALWFKPNAAIFYIALGIWFVLRVIKDKKPIYLLFVALLIVEYKCIGLMQIVLVNKFFPDTNPAGCPLVAWLAMGLQEGSRASGWYNGYVWNVWSEYSGDAALITNASVQSINERLAFFVANPIEPIRFFYRKITTVWCEPTFQSMWISFNGNDTFYFYKPPSLLQHLFIDGKLRLLYELYCDALQIVIFVFALYGLVCQFKQKNFKLNLFVIVFLGGFVYFTLFEGKSLYVLPYFTLLIMFAAIGLHYSHDRLPARLAHAPLGVFTRKSKKKGH